VQNICCILRSLALCLAAPLGEKKKSLNGSILGVKKAINFSAKPTPSSPYPPTLVRATPCQSKSRCCFGNFSTKCTLRVRLGGRHGGSATSCFCADPCTHSVQDLNRLLCFRHSQNHGIWWFHFLVSMKVKFFCDLELGRALPPTSVKGPTPLGKVGLCLVRLVHLNCV